MSFASEALKGSLSRLPRGIEGEKEGRKAGKWAFGGKRVRLSEKGVKRIEDHGKGS